MAHTILLADDSITIRKVVELSFHDTDIRVESVASGQEAVERMRAVQPDLVLADVVMPEPSGYELCRRIKESDNPVPVLLLRGAFEPFDDGRAEACGSDGELVKPFDTGALVDLVNRLLNPEPEPVVQPPEEEPEEEQPFAADPEGVDAEALLDDLADAASFSEGAAEELDVSDLKPDYAAGPDAPVAPPEEDAIRRAVEAVSADVIREIAWEVVPELAEALIRERIRELEQDDKDS